jgi:hypothetical protein
MLWHDAVSVKVGDLAWVQVSASAYPSESFLDTIVHQQPKGVHEVTRLMRGS